jgi:hypothetical protein
MDAEGTAMKRWILVVCALTFFTAISAYAHVGSPDVYAEGQAGPYRLSVVIRPPLVIPGVAEIDVRAETPHVDNITITPVPLTGEAAKHPPVPDTMEKPSRDDQFFIGHLWIMAAGSWQVRFVVSGQQGQGVLSIPLPATAIATQKMRSGMGALLAFLGVLLFSGMVSIVGAATSKAKLPPDQMATESDIRHGRVAMAIAGFVLAAVILFGNHWWNAEAAEYAGNIYKPLQMDSTLEQSNVLDLKLHDPGWLALRSTDDLIPDHNHLMHLYVVRWPELDVVFHLHPQPNGAGEFQLALPSMPAGDYHLYADVVHANGFPETLVSALMIRQQITGHPLTGDDAEGLAKAVGMRSDSSIAGATEQRFRLPDGYTMIWKMPGLLAPRIPENFQFELLDPEGKAPDDMALYMGMLGHAAFLKTDGKVFAHIHPDGTMAMAAYMMANPKAQLSNMANSDGMNMPNMQGMDMEGTGLPNTVSFPYGFPSAGQYRIFVQMKHGKTIETGVFDANVHQ